MKKYVLLALLVVAISWNANAGNDNKSVLTVNAGESKVEWLGKKVTGEHKGNIAIASGELEFSDDKLTGGTFEIDMHSITNSDLENEEGRNKLVGHLKSDDFFGVEKYPKAHLVIKNVTHEQGSKYMVSGDVTIKGITKTIEFPVELSENDSKAWATAMITMDRSEFDVKYGSGSFFDGLGDKMIYHDFVLNVTVVANK